MNFFPSITNVSLCFCRLKLNDLICSFNLFYHFIFWWPKTKANRSPFTTGSELQTLWIQLLILRKRKKNPLMAWIEFACVHMCVLFLYSSFLPQTIHVTLFRNSNLTLGVSEYVSDALFVSMWQWVGLVTYSGCAPPSVLWLQETDTSCLKLELVKKRRG